MAVIRGTSGADKLTGTNRRDRLFGYEGDDRLDGGAGDDEVIGGDGSDDISDAAGSDRLDGGDGDDRISIHRTSMGATEQVALLGGDGRDSIHYHNRRSGSATIDLGDGDDHLSLAFVQDGGVTITTGEGRDAINFNPYGDYALGRLVEITDFTVGDGGDHLSFSHFIGATLQGWDGKRNPFGKTGFLRVASHGADTVFEIDIDGRGDAHGFVALATLADIDASALTAANLDGYDPTGACAPEQRLRGTAGDDTIDGGTGHDVIRGGEGGDFLVGDSGADVLRGGAGDDLLRGEAGNDRLFGGDGNDLISDDGGSNRIDGGAGDDIIHHGLGTGGVGGGSGDARIDTGNGQDRVLYQNIRSGSLTLDLGSGDDRLDLYTLQDGGATVTTSAGADVIAIGWDGADHFPGVLNVTDFATGFGGDLLKLREFLTSALTGWDGGDPFASGHLRLADDDGAALVEVDRDGAGGAFDFTTLVRLTGVAASDLTAANLDVFALPASAIAAGSAEFAI